MNSLPRDVSNELMKYIPRNQQYQTRLVNKRFEGALFDWNECCLEPTKAEIVTFLFEQSRLLSNPNTQHQSVFAGEDYPANSFRIYFNKPGRLYILRMNTLNGDITIEETPSYTGITTVPMKSAQEALNILKDSVVNFSEIHNKFILHFEDIFAKRQSCRTHGIDNFPCFLQFLAHHITSMFNVSTDMLTYAYEFLTSDATNRLEDDIKEKFNLTVNILRPFISDRANQQGFKDWLYQWILKLNPEDLYAEAYY